MTKGEPQTFIFADSPCKGAEVVVIVFSWPVRRRLRFDFAWPPAFWIVSSSGRRSCPLRTIRALRFRAEVCLRLFLAPTVLALRNRIHIPTRGSHTSSFKFICTNRRIQPWHPPYRRLGCHKPHEQLPPQVMIGGVLHADSAASTFAIVGSNLVSRSWANLGAEQLEGNRRCSALSDTLSSGNK